MGLLVENMEVTFVVDIHKSCRAYLQPPSASLAGVCRFGWKRVRRSA